MTPDTTPRGSTVDSDSGQRLAVPDRTPCPSCDGSCCWDANDPSLGRCMDCDGRGSFPASADEIARGKAWMLAWQGFKVWCNERGATYINNTFIAPSPEAFR